MSILNGHTAALNKFRALFIKRKDTIDIINACQNSVFSQSLSAMKRDANIHYSQIYLHDRIICSCFKV